MLTHHNLPLFNHFLARNAYKSKKKTHFSWGKALEKDPNPPSTLWRAKPPSLWLLSINVGWMFFQPARFDYQRLPHDLGNLQVVNLWWTLISVNGNFRRRYCTMEGHDLWGYSLTWPWNLGLYMLGTSNFGSWNGHWTKSSPAIPNPL